MPADAPRTAASPITEQEARSALVDALRVSLGGSGASAQRLRELRAAADRVKAGGGDVEQDSDPGAVLMAAFTTVAKAAAGHVVFAVHLRMLLRGLAALGVPIRDPRWRTCVGIAVGFSVCARAVYAAVHGEALEPPRTVTVTSGSPTGMEQLAEQLRQTARHAGRHPNS